MQAADDEERGHPGTMNQEMPFPPDSVPRILRPRQPAVAPYQKESQTAQGLPLADQWLRLCTSTAGGLGSVPGQGTEIPQANGIAKNTDTRVGQSRLHRTALKTACPQGRGNENPCSITEALAQEPGI